METLEEDEAGASQGASGPPKPQLEALSHGAPLTGGGCLVWECRRRVHVRESMPVMWTRLTSVQLTPRRHATDEGCVCAN
eukprot:3211045-Rhodomonas_salina.1